MNKISYLPNLYFFMFMFQNLLKRSRSSEGQSYSVPRSNKKISFLPIVNVFIRVFPKVDHSARSDRIVLVEYTTGSVVKLNFC